MHIIEGEHGVHTHTHEGEAHTHTHEGVHGAHTHTHADHDHERAETDALLGYMVDHNIHHAEELKEIAHTLRHEGRDEIADLIEEAVDEFNAGNEKLSEALSLIKN